MVDNFVLEGRELYKDRNIRIHKSVYGTDEHDVVIGEKYIFLDRGIMKEWANADATRIRTGYFNLKGINYEAEICFMPVEEFGWALAKARIKELEDVVF